MSKTTELGFLELQARLKSFEVDRYGKLACTLVLGRLESAPPFIFCYKIKY